MIFACLKRMEGARKQFRELKNAVSHAGRDPGKVKLAGSIYTIVGETRSISDEKRATIEALSVPEDSLTLISEVTNCDFGSVPYTKARGARLMVQ